MGIPKNWDRRDETNPFTFIIDLVREDDSVKEQLAGANNVYVIRAAWDEVQKHRQPTDILRLRQGARIMERARGTGEEYRRYMKLHHGIDIDG